MARVHLLLLVGYFMTSMRVGLCTGEYRVSSADGVGVMDYLKPHSRNKRQTVVNINSSQRQELLDAHNKLRRIPQASDMRFMTWNNVLAQMAQDWANRCVFEHGQPSGYSNQPYDFIGQNIASMTGAHIDMTQVIQDFYDEIQFYDYNSGSCSGVCGHYTQVVWSTSWEVGCGLAPESQCGFEFIVCNYGPGGNSGGKPYRIGEACTQCDTGEAWCIDGLCASQGQCQQDSSCQCKAKCYNCATYNPSSCSCTCAAGWLGPDCSDRCVDTDSQCGANPGWPADWCTPEYQYVLDACFVMCGICDPNSSGQQCPVAGPDQAAVETTTTTSTTTTTTSTTTTTTPSTTTTTTTPSTTTTSSTTTTQSPSTTTTTGSTTTTVASGGNPAGPSTSSTTSTTTSGSTTTTTQQQGGGGASPSTTTTASTTTTTRPQGGSGANPTTTTTRRPQGGSGANPTTTTTTRPQGGSGANPTTTTTTRPQGGSGANPTTTTTARPQGGSGASPTTTPEPRPSTTLFEGCRLCVDHEYCGTVYPSEWCQQATYAMSIYCPVMCSICAYGDKIGNCIEVIGPTNPNSAGCPKASHLHYSLIYFLLMSLLVAWMFV